MAIWWLAMLTCTWTKTKWAWVVPLIILHTKRRWASFQMQKFFNFHISYMFYGGKKTLKSAEKLQQRSTNYYKSVGKCWIFVGLELIDSYNWTWSDTGRHKQTRADMGRHGQTWADTGRHGQIWIDTSRHRQTRADTSRHEQTRADTGRHNRRLKEDTVTIILLSLPITILPAYNLCRRWCKTSRQLYKADCDVCGVTDIWLIGQTYIQPILSTSEIPTLGKLITTMSFFTIDRPNKTCKQRSS